MYIILNFFFYKLETMQWLYNNIIRLLYIKSILGISCISRADFYDCSITVTRFNDRSTDRAYLGTIYI